MTRRIAIAPSSGAVRVLRTPPKEPAKKKNEFFEKKFIEHKCQPIGVRATATITTSESASGGDAEEELETI